MFSLAKEMQVVHVYESKLILSTFQDYLQRRNGYPVKIRYPSGMDKTHRRRIMSFLADNGWIGIT